jgi:hypothetical protein
MSQNRKVTITLEPTRYSKYRTDLAIKNQLNEIKNKSIPAQISAISHLQAEQAVPVLLRILMKLNEAVEKEAKSVYGGSTHFAPTLDAIANAINIFGEADRVMQMSTLRKAGYFFTLNKYKMIQSLNELTARIDDIIITGETLKLWTRASTWLEGVHQITASKVTPQSKIVQDVAEKLPLVDSDDEALWRTCKLSKMKISQYYHRGAEITNRKCEDYKNKLRLEEGIATNDFIHAHHIIASCFENKNVELLFLCGVYLEQARPVAMRELKHAVKESTLLAPKNRNGIFAGQPNKLVREINRIHSAIRSEECDEAKGYQALVKLATQMGGESHPIAVAANNCLLFTNDSHTTHKLIYGR